uniref:Uncharacterized protein n=1 Tax=Siphoviridae sp. ctqED62 TaxID=2826468 RepID=A0A8S5MR04_9CAUD|nr:MAG TPA: hypothetical protein [Siphoviridae sp. ctqED62]
MYIGDGACKRRIFDFPPHRAKRGGSRRNGVCPIARLLVNTVTHILKR